MKKNMFIKKIIIILINIIILSTILISSANAFAGGNVSDFDSNSDDLDTSISTPINNAFGTVMQIMRIISVSIAMIMLLVIAMRYMVASPGDRADIKKHAIAYVVGAFILFGVTGILSILINIGDSIGNESTGGTT